MSRGATGRAALLRGLPLFRGRTRRELGRIAALFDETAAEPDEVLVREGTAAREAFVVVAGRAEVTRSGREIGTLGPGDLFGESAFVGGTRSATVSALTPMRLLVVGPAGLAALLGEPDVAARILRAVVERDGAPAPARALA